ncbi:hypothetical protein C0V72_10335 [Porphyrobacter sp. TH134]|uniref:DUF6702 family protein n=1 Tax=Porphyrobacter sp. TH134 TaxID=2067450 RepID=UPI000C7AC1EC|nr:DUF6702 family protein [Porphyrobacter sp. TH134]PLK23347.1 hypothetical protein C0V72_10335 [Porphyrobacter sp. TH134]
MLRRLLVCLALVLAPIGAGTASAHQQKFTISTVSFNARTGMIEIAHQVPVHDAEHALVVQRTGNPNIHTPDIIGSEDSREAFARYVRRRFLLMVNGAIITPDYVGSEITGGSLWVYQETPAPEGEVLVRLNSQILTDVWARQENRVNIGGGTAVTTFIFHAGDVPQAAPLPR